MIKVKVRHVDGRIASFEVSGHGKDIVCAAVSALAETVVEGLRKVAGLNPAVVIDDEAGYLSADLGPDLTNSDAQIILATMMVGLRGIARANRRHVKIEDID